jgi:hypothetical protein
MISMARKDLPPALMSFLLLVGIAALAPAIVLRIAIGERVLFAIEGYSDFAKGRKRLFPWIW